jgi:hypothetical protein
VFALPPRADFFGEKMMKELTFASHALVDRSTALIFVAEVLSAEKIACSRVLSSPHRAFE